MLLFLGDQPTSVCSFEACSLNTLPDTSTSKLPLTSSVMMDFSAHQRRRTDGIPPFIVLCKSRGTAVTPVRGNIFLATLNLASLTFSISSDKRNIPPVIPTTEAALITSLSVCFVVLPRRTQSGSLCHQRCPRTDRLRVFRSIPRSEGKVPLSQCGSGNSGSQVGPVSHDTLIPSAHPIAVPSGHPHPMINVSSPAASLIVRKPK
mmetsp:Transcript_22061/g.33403  ORF Transcript_22061/g.33403 Transcript_22061/m.33403 type:complete len:205 (+) Transcript_22061:427-1041(+)